MLDEQQQATQEPTDAEVEVDEMDGLGGESAAAAAEGEELAEAMDAVGEAVAEAAEVVDAAIEDLMPTIVVHYLGFTINRIKLPTGHFPTKAKLVEAIEPAILNKGWNIGSKDLTADRLPEVGCYREKAKALAAATRAAKAAAPCRLQILDSNGKEVETRTFRQVAE